MVEELVEENGKKVGFICSIFTSPLHSLFMSLGVFLWQCHSTTYRPVIPSVACWVVFGVSLWLNTFFETVPWLQEYF